MQGRFALHVASKALEYYAETVFKVPYPLKKSDLLAIPGEWSGFHFCGDCCCRDKGASFGGDGSDGVCAPFCPCV